ncbi:hypothetical protein BGZ72_006046 [Mortierella alpina]|nr:hypothetical protein BGZ72_006046 [Mortierella alpina]
MSLNDSINPWANIVTPAPSASPVASAATGALTKDLATPSVVYSNTTQPTISFDGSVQPKNVINDVFLSSTMLYDDTELYSSFDSDSDSGFSTPSQQTEEHQDCFSTPMTPMSPFMENDTEDEQSDLPEQEGHSEASLSESDDATNMVVDMKRPMFIPVSICDPRDFATMASLPTPPEINARKHSYDFLRNSDAFLLGGISATKRRRMLSVDMMSSCSSEGPASPPASNAGDDEVAELSDADSSASSFTARRRSLFQMRNVRHLTPTSPSMPEIVCFAPPTHEEYDYHPELDRSDDEDDEEEDDEERVTSEVKDDAAVAAVSDLFVVEAEQESGPNAYFEDHYSSSDEEAEIGYRCENEMQIDAMSSSDDSDSDLSDVEDYQFPSVRRRGTWHGPSLEDLEKSASKCKGRSSQTQEPQPHKKEQEQLVFNAERLVGSTISTSSPAPRVSASKKSCDAKLSKAPTLFQILTKANIDWCRYCGTTEGVNWRPGPWGKRTLCNKHGCDFKGYGFACKLPRLDLTSYVHETVEQRIRPVLQHCCPKAFHQKCHGETAISDEIASSDKPWFCDETCRDNVKKRRVCVELPKKRLPLMSTPKPASAATMAGPSAAAGSAAEMGRPRGIRASISGELPPARSK